MQEKGKLSLREANIWGPWSQGQMGLPHPPAKAIVLSIPEPQLKPRSSWVGNGAFLAPSQALRLGWEQSSPQLKSSS